MFIVITKDGKPVDAFYKTTGKGYIEIDYKSLLALPYKAKLAV